MNTVPSATVNATHTDELFFIDPEEDEIELNPEKAMSAEETALYTAPPENDDSGCDQNDTTWD